MRSYVITGYGSVPDVLRLVDSPAVAPRANEVAVRLEAAALNPIDLNVIAGKLKRLNHYRMPHRIGFDGAGVVVSLGSDVAGLSVGDAVFVRASREATGTFAEQITLDAAFVARKPQNTTFGEAASLPLVGLTALQGLVDRASAKAGQHVLIHGGSGGVGTFAIQFAKHLGLLVTATTSSKNVEFVRGLGADEVIAYDQTDYRKSGAEFDIVLDTLGGDATLDAFDVCRRGGAVVSVAGVPDEKFADQVGAGPVLRLLMRFISRKVLAKSRRTGIRYFRFLTESDGKQLAQISALVESGQVRPVVDSTFAFGELPAALERLAQGRSRGKIVLEVAPGHGGHWR